MTGKLHFPKMIEVRQAYPSSLQLDFSKSLEEQFNATGVLKEIVPGMRIAVGVGSRGIANLREIVQAALRLLIAAGARPFVLPAMGSHGGATPEGQYKVLAEYGITTESLGVPIETSMEVRRIGSACDGLDVVFSAPALDADGVIVINRIKPHTDFHGNLGSGIQKMLTIGFGKQVGAANAHRAAVRLGYEFVLREFSKVILETVPVLCGVAIVEDLHHQTAAIEVLRPADVPREEDRLLAKARSLMPRLPLDQIDLLIIDQIGKEISGTGMDTNIIGREISGYSTALNHDFSEGPSISRIFVRDLSPETKGNGIGIGLADFTTKRAVNQLDLHSMYTNALTSIGLQPAKIPIQFETDSEAIQAALATLGSLSSETASVVRIVNTLSLERLLVSESCVDVLSEKPGVTVLGQAQDMQFNDVGNLQPF